MENTRSGIGKLVKKKQNLLASSGDESSIFENKNFYPN